MSRSAVQPNVARPCRGWCAVAGANGLARSEDEWRSRPARRPMLARARVWWGPGPKTPATGGLRPEATRRARPRRKSAVRGENWKPSPPLPPGCLAHPLLLGRPESNAHRSPTGRGNDGSPGQEGGSKQRALTFRSRKLDEARPGCRMKRKLDLLFGRWRHVTGGGRAHNGLPGLCRAGAGPRERLSRGAMGGRVSRRTLPMMMSHALRGQVALVHAFGAVLAWRAAVLIHAFRLAFAASHAGSAGPERCRAYDAGRRRHVCTRREVVR